jgi:hypothetical protein
MTKVNDAVHVVGETLGVTVKGDMSTRTVGRCIREGGIAAKIQIADEIHKAKSKFKLYLNIFCILIINLTTAFTMAGDSTTIKHIDYATKHIYIKAPTYDEDKSDLKNSHRFFGITALPNHKASTQMTMWQSATKDMVDLYNSTPTGKANPMHYDEFGAKSIAMMADHSADQVLFGANWESFHIACANRIKGRLEALDLSPIELLPVISEVCDRKIAAVGGYEKWFSLSPEEQVFHDASAYEKLVELLGAAAYEALAPEEKQFVNLFIHAGCCMHKELNSNKGGNTAMMAWWAANGLVGPIKLMNRDNARAAADGSSAAAQLASNISTAGGVKAASIAGAIFNHKDDKKGHHESLQAFWLTELGYRIPFPDTSNIRYQSHCLAATELITHLSYYIKFLEQVRNKKENGRLNHMEQNLYDALHDIPTLTELCVLSIYSEWVGILYNINARDGDKNACDMGPDHDEVKKTIRKYITTPSHLLDPDFSKPLVGLFGIPIQHPEALYAIHAMKHKLPHLKGVLVAFLTGALETWECFTSEFAADGIIANATAEERAKAWMPTTNDHAEGSLGDLRVWFRKAPNMTLEGFNDRKMYKKNNTKGYMADEFTPELHMLVKQKARVKGKNGAETLAELGAADKAAAAANKVRRDATQEKKKTRKAALDAKLAALVPEMDPSKLREKSRTVPVIELQLEFHRITDSAIPKKSALKNKAAKLEALLQAVERVKDGLVKLPEFEEEESGEEFIFSDGEEGEEEDEE